MLNFLTNVKNKVIAGGVLLIGILLFVVRLLRRKVEVLEHENEVKTKIAEIHEDQAEAKEEILNEEPEKIKEAVKKSSGKSRRDRADRL